MNNTLFLAFRDQHIEQEIGTIANTIDSGTTVGNARGGDQSAKKDNQQYFGQKQSDICRRKSCSRSSASCFNEDWT